MNPDCKKTYSPSHLQTMLPPNHLKMVKKMQNEWILENQMNLLESTTPLIEFYNKYEVMVETKTKNYERQNFIFSSTSTQIQ